MNSFILKVLYHIATSIKLHHQVMVTNPDQQTNAENHTPFGFRTRGLLGMYKGLEAKLTQTVLMSALMFLTYEKIAAFVFSIMGGKYRGKAK